MESSIELPFAHLLLQADELDELYLAVDGRCISIGHVLGAATTDAMKAALAERWALNNSLRTAIGEARSGLDPHLARMAEIDGERF